MTLESPSMCSILQNKTNWMIIKLQHPKDTKTKKLSITKANSNAKQRQRQRKQNNFTIFIIFPFIQFFISFVLFYSFIYFFCSLLCCFFCIYFTFPLVHWILFCIYISLVYCIRPLRCCSIADIIFSYLNSNIFHYISFHSLSSVKNVTHCSQVHTQWFFSVIFSVQAWIVNNSSY